MNLYFSFWLIPVSKFFQNLEVTKISYLTSTFSLQNWNTIKIWRIWRMNMTVLQQVAERRLTKTASLAATSNTFVISFNTYLV